MSDVQQLMLAGGAGLCLGFFFFGALWLTVRSLPASRSPLVLIFGSLLGRIAVTMAGFYLVMAGHWERLSACVFGFVLMRYAFLWWWPPEVPQKPIHLRVVKYKAD